MRIPLSSTIKTSSVPITGQNLSGEEFISKILDRRWALSSPDVKISQILIQNRRTDGIAEEISVRNMAQPRLRESMSDEDSSLLSFYVIRDDLLHALVNGNKARKLDSVLPLLEDNGVTDVVTCGGCQSAHTAAVAVSCAERGLKSHLLLRGEEPEILTGYNLVSKLYGNAVYVPRSLYANRQQMLASHAESVAGRDGSVVWLPDMINASSRDHNSADHQALHRKSAKVCVIREGAGDAVAILGFIRLVRYLSQSHVFGKTHPMRIVVDAGTGTTAIGLSLAAAYLRLPWTVTGVMLADTIDGYKEKERNLVSEFRSIFFSAPSPEAGSVEWVDRRSPRKFGNVLDGEVAECRKIAERTGILVDPMYTLAAWDHAVRLRLDGGGDGKKVVMLHTGGTMGMFGLAQRYKSYFKSIM